MQGMAVQSLWLMKLNFNKTEISDNKYGLSASDIGLTEQFYIKG